MPESAPSVSLATFGWNDRLVKQFEQVDPAGKLQPARVLTEHRGGYVLATNSGEMDGAVSGRFRHEAQMSEDFPAVGDWVAVNLAEGGQSAVIQAVLPRQTRFARPARGDMAGAQVVAANVDVVLVVAGLDHDFNLRRLERYVTLAFASGAVPVIVLNKADLCDDVAGRVADVASVAPGVPIRVLSAIGGTGLESLTPLLETGKTVALLGSSGVGKSTIVNAILGYERQATSAVRDDDGRGRHTTTMRELLVTPSGALLIDSPGIRSVGMWDADEGLNDAFADVAAFAASCRFSDCQHGSEPGCAVQAAIINGSLPRARLDSQQKLEREWAHLARRVDHSAREVERRRWKTIHKSVRNHMKVKYGSET
ncbi:MAG: ribosome small subunit-dependent GTPase A [Candidatus Limnocylindrales bacterium]